ncbi:uncharacterized protein LOC124312974 isoform X1 [Daphnia pulicaria]|uniref:uncharacterized protein LOC124312974 isoform X1 n=2 Tax=Daphnia pulicaria TaxID=35523 RepID=UPI001EEAE3AE|nr:uncharacterized protein LOC124312974 isoform X1 [Daphnia pulicaria]XP_046633552.1 uncharacterized protein LOC124312974 isoform X1 [Daphnia pulicaria]XP_046633553.1 uncharacterized protein LOC124312974 isoform X1 [Daphnia pulicaria]XP_046633554.1 uncharacterized protein LOC124312974 isoform X1 [Daphnia pulicaria]XP_046633555.1 uncharacterized protein LOC124312974 isoform X1 [Daphnia pulicaria]
MAAQRSSLGNNDVPPVVPGRSRSPSYIRSISASQLPTTTMSSTNNNNNNNKPPPVPRNSLIRSKSAQLYQQQQASQVMTPLPHPPIQVKNNHHHHPLNDPVGTAGSHHHNNNNNNMKDLPESIPAESVLMSKSFSFESPNGVRRKIPVTPVLSTGPKKSSQHHDTLHYRHGTLVFPSDSSIGQPNKFIDTIPVHLNSPSQGPSEAVMSPAAGPVIHHHQFSHPATIFNQFVVSLVDHSLLKLCQDGDVGTLSRYLALHHEKVPARSLNAIDATGKSSLLHAAMTGNVPIARLLVKLPGLDVNLADNEGNTALHLAAQAGHADIVSLLTLCPNLTIDIRNNAGLTALMKASLQGRVRCTRLLLLAGASPVLRDFGRGLCSVEWARLTGRSKCVEIIDKYMDKMQLNPGLGLKSFHHGGGVVASSEPSLQQFSKRSSLVLLPSSKTKDSWVKNTLKKAIRIVSGGSDPPSNKGSTFSVASQLTGSGVMSASVLLPGDPSRRSSMPVLPTSSGGAGGGASGFVAELFDRHRSQYHRSSSHQHSNFVVPRIQVSYWSNTAGGNIPPPPPGTPKVIPPEMRPSHSRQRSRSSIRS